MTRRLFGHVLALALLLAAVAATPAAGADDAATRVVFERGCDIWIAPLSGAPAENLTNSAACETNPTISGSGRYVAWGSLTPPIGSVVLDRQTGTRTSIPGAVQPDLSPVSDEITYNAFTAATSVVDIYVARVDGTGVRNLTNDVSGPANGNYAPQWAPDGASILFSRGTGAPFCRVNRGSFDELYPSYRLARVTTGGALTTVLSEPLRAFRAGQERGGVSAHARMTVPPANGSGFCTSEPSQEITLVVNGADRAPASSWPAVLPNGDVVYSLGLEVRLAPADGGPVRTLFAGSNPDAEVVTGAAPGPPGPPGGTTALPAPVRGKSVNVTPVSGVVRVKRPGGRFAVLTAGQQIPVGSIVDVTRGRVRLESAGRVPPAVNSAEFYAGVFLIRQRPGASLTRLFLQGGNLAACPRRSGTASEAQRRKTRKPVPRRLWGKGDGDYQTVGRNSATTVRGTTWLVEDRCDGTFSRVTQGRVAVRDFVLRRTVLLRAPQSYLARRR